MNKIKLIVLGVFLSFIVLEVGLRLTGFAILSMQRANSIGDYSDTYRILALGESTTSHISDIQSSWPTELEIILNNKSKGMKFKVFNEGIPGTNTAFILGSLEENLDRYNPHMVVTMMGTNDDGNNLMYQDKTNTNITFLVEDLRLYKLIKLLHLASNNRTWEIIGTGNGDFDEGKQLSLAQYYRGLGMLEEADNIVREIIRKNPRQNEAYFELGKIDLGRPDKDTKVFYDKFYQKKKLNHTDVYGFETTKNNYRQLYEILRKRGIKYVAMQYPNVDIGVLEEIFNESDIIFVSNEENFMEAFKQAEFDEFFTDDFGNSRIGIKGNFGHATMKGNQLIAENLADVILNEMETE